jgi:hypothetical protein
MSKQLHLIQPVGFSLPNILAALAHDRISTATLLHTSEIPEIHIHRAIEIANEIRKNDLNPYPTLIEIESPDAESKKQYQSVQDIEISQESNIVIGVTGGTQRLIGNLLSRFGTNRLLWVSNEPKVVLKVGSQIWPESLELTVEDYTRLYGIADNSFLLDRAEIHQGRLLISNHLEILPHPSGAPTKERQKWSKKCRSKVAIIAKEIEELENLFGRIQFRYNLDVKVGDDSTHERIRTILGRLPKSVSIKINDQNFFDPITSVAVDSNITKSYLRQGIYEILESTDTPSDSGKTLHLLVGKYNSVSIANAIANHRPQTVCLWGINHTGSEGEIQLLCNQVFSLVGWINGTLSRDMKIKNCDSPQSEHVPNRIFFINTRTLGIQGKLEELSKIVNIDQSTLDYCSGTGQLSSIFHQTLSNFSPDLKINYTNPWTGEITDLLEGNVRPGKGIGIVDRLWLSQRPVIKHHKSRILNPEEYRLLCDIAKNSKTLTLAKPNSRYYNLPQDSWDDIEVTLVSEKRKKRSTVNRIHYSRGSVSLDFPKGSVAAGHWIEDMLGYAIPRHFETLDCITSISLITRSDDGHTDIEIDAIFMTKDGLTFVSCKRGNGAWENRTSREVISWSLLLGGPNSKSMVVHSNVSHLPVGPGTRFPFATSHRQVLAENVGFFNWLEFIDKEFEMLNPNNLSDEEE